MLTIKAKQLMEAETDFDREKKVKSFLNKIIPLDEIKTGRVTKFVYDSLTK